MSFRNKRTAYFSLLLTFVLWGSLYVASQIVLQSLPTFTVAFLRFVLAWLFLTVLLRFQNSSEGKISEMPKDPSYKKYIFILGFLGYTLSVGIQLLGTRLAGATMASLINSINPITISVMAVFLLKEPLTKNKLIGILLAIFGVYLIVGGTEVYLPGVILSLIAVVGWSFVSVITRRALSQYPALQITRHAVGVAAICNLPIGVAELLLTKNPVTISLPLILCLLYMGICCTGLTYILWNKSLGTLPASTCSAFYPLQPFTSALLGILVFHESPTLGFFFGGILITVGILISLLWKKKGE